MKPKTELDPQQLKETVVGVFDNPNDASRAAASLREPDLEMQRVSRINPLASDDLPEIQLDEVKEVSLDAVTEGFIKGGAIGAGSGLIFLGIPGLNLVAPIATGIVGAWIGALAASDEAQKAAETPTDDHYRKLLEEGKSLIVISGDEATRYRIEGKLKDLGAEEVHQHPPTKNQFRTPK